MKNSYNFHQYLIRNVRQNFIYIFYIGFSFKESEYWKYFEFFQS